MFTFPVLAVVTDIDTPGFGFGFIVRGESPGCRLISTASMFEWLRNLLPHHSQGSSAERWSRNTLRVVTAGVFYVLGCCFFKVPLYFK